MLIYDPAAHLTRVFDQARHLNHVDMNWDRIRDHLLACFTEGAFRLAFTGTQLHVPFNDDSMDEETMQALATSLYDWLRTCIFNHAHVFADDFASGYSFQVRVGIDTRELVRTRAGVMRIVADMVDAILCTCNGAFSRRKAVAFDCDGTRAESTDLFILAFIV